MSASLRAQARARARAAAPARPDRVRARSRCCSPDSSAARCTCSGSTTSSCRTQGSARHSRELEVPAHRGRIVDRFGEPLALSTPVKSLWVFPDKFEASPEQLAKLARILETTPQRLAGTIDAHDDFAFVAKQVAPETSERAMALRIKGLHDQNEYRRFYPGGEVTAHIVGFTGDRDAGQEGIELAQQGWLAGVPGSRRVIINRRSEAVEDVAAIRAPQAGRDLALAIDTRLQYLAFRELKAAIELNKAKAGGLVIVDVATGEILALANWPTYNPNRRDKVARERMRNRALTDVFEPGSTLKPFTIAAALQAGKVRPDTVIQTGGGTMTIGTNTIHDAHAEGALTVEQVIQKSSNVGAAKIALSLPSETMWEMFSEAGFGVTPKTGFPGEVGGTPARRRRRGSRSSRRRWRTDTASRSTSCSSRVRTRCSRPTAK